VPAVPCSRRILGIARDLSLERVTALEKGKAEQEAYGEIETHHPGYLGAKDTYCVASVEIEDIDHSRTKAKRPQSNGIFERFHKTVQDEFYAVAFRKRLCRDLGELQRDLDAYIDYYSNSRPHSGRYCYGKTRMETFSDSRHLAKAKELELQHLTPGVALETTGLSDQD